MTSDEEKNLDVEATRLQADEQRVSSDDSTPERKNEKDGFQDSKVEDDEKKESEGSISDFGVSIPQRCTKS